MRKFDLVLPAYNEAPNLPSLLTRAVQAAQQSGYLPERFQVILVDNGSTDETAAVLEDLKDEPLGKWFRIVKVPKNLGYGHGLRKGLEATEAKYVGWSHADLQADPLNAFLALEKVEADPNGKTLVKGQRFGRNWKDRLVTYVFESTARVLLGLKESEINAQPKIFSASLLKHLQRPPETFAFDVYVLYQAARNGYRIETIPVNFPPRIHGVSKWASSFFRRYRTILGMIHYLWSLRKEEGRL